MKSKTYLYLLILIVLAVAAYFLTTDKGEKTSSYKFTQKKLFELDSAKVDKVEIKNVSGDVVISKASGTWMIEQPFQYKTVSANIENLVSNLKNLELESIVSTNPANKDTYGFKDPQLAEVTVYEGGVQKGKFLMGSTTASNSNYIKTLDSDIIYLANNIDRYNFVKENINDWRDKNIFTIPKEAVKSVEYIYGGEKYTIKADSTGKYSIGTDTVGTAFDGILNLLQNFQTTSFKDTTLSDQTSFDEKVIIDWGPKTEINFLKTNTSPPKYLVQVAGDKQIYEMDENYAKNLLKTKKEILGR